MKGKKTMTQENAVILLIVSWVVSGIGVFLSFGIETMFSKRVYLLIASITTILAVVAYICYLIYYLPYA